MPYELYSDEDIAHRVIYVEASRGCPFTCEFCLSALDRTAVPFPLAPLLDELATLHRRGARERDLVVRAVRVARPDLAPVDAVAAIDARCAGADGGQERLGQAHGDASCLGLEFKRCAFKTGKIIIR